MNAPLPQDAFQPPVVTFQHVVGILPCMCSTVGGEIPSDFNSLDPDYALHRINDHPISFGSQGKKISVLLV